MSLNLIGHVEPAQGPEIELERAKQRIAELERERDEWREQCAEECNTKYRVANERNAALTAYDAEVTGRRDEVRRCHAEMLTLRAELAQLRRERVTPEERVVK